MLEEGNGGFGDFLDVGRFGFVWLNVSSSFGVEWGFIIRG